MSKQLTVSASLCTLAMALAAVAAFAQPAPGGSFANGPANAQGSLLKVLILR